MTVCHLSLINFGFNSGAAFWAPNTKSPLNERAFSFAKMAPISLDVYQPFRSSGSGVVGPDLVVVICAVDTEITLVTGTK
jgi:hypothetical protein